LKEEMNGRGRRKEIQLLMNNSARIVLQLRTEHKHSINLILSPPLPRNLFLSLNQFHFYLLNVFFFSNSSAFWLLTASVNVRFSIIAHLDSIGSL
jgi:hypothetical protein